MNTFDNFSIPFRENSVYLGGREIPLGQTTVEFLNWPAEPLEELQTRAEAFCTLCRRMVERRDTELISAVQKSSNAVYDILSTLPPYRDLEMDEELNRNAFSYLAEMPEEWEEIITPGTHGHGLMMDLIRQMEELPNQLRAFRSQVRHMADQYFAHLSTLDSKSYGVAFGRYYRTLSYQGFLHLPEQEYEQSFPAYIKFVPVILPGEDQPTIVEEAQFGELHAFLYTDFYRGLMRGHAPRRCRNCGRFFLLSNGYNICYCNNIAPGETKRTCRQVGAHRVAARLWAGDTPLRKEYAKTVNRLKAQRRTGKISGNDFIIFENQAKAILEQADHGELTDEEAMAQLHDINRMRERN